MGWHGRFSGHAKCEGACVACLAVANNPRRAPAYSIYMLAAAMTIRSRFHSVYAGVGV